MTRYPCREEGPETGTKPLQKKAGMALANAFTSGVQQVALVVRDMDKALGEYTYRFGIGP